MLFLFFDTVEIERAVQQSDQWVCHLDELSFVFVKTEFDHRLNDVKRLKHELVKVGLVNATDSITRLDEVVQSWLQFEQLRGN